MKKSALKFAAVEVKTAGRNLREAYLSASRSHFPPSGRTPDLTFFAAPQYNTWIELTYNQNEKDILFLMVAPQVEKGAAAREVEIPPGRWVADDGTAFDGPARITVKTPLSRLPYFVRSKK